MTLKNLQQNWKKAALVLSLAFGFFVLSADSVSAQKHPQKSKQDRRDDRRDRQRERSDDYRNRNRDNDYRNNDGYYGNNPNYRDYDNNYSTARQEGYRDGLAAGRDDSFDGERYNPQKHSDYKKGTDGYNGRGSKGQYKQAYRDAFLEGYAQGYNRNQNVYNNRNRRRGY